MEFYLQTFMYLILLCLLCLKESNESILSPQTVDLWEYSSVTLTCIITVPCYCPTPVKWTLESNTGTYFATMDWSLTTKTCFLFESQFLNDFNLYSYNCTFGWNEVTIKNLTRDQHKEKWTCSDAAVSGEAKISIKVPVNEVTLIADQGKVAVNENSSLVLRCITSECRPGPSFQWYAISAGKPLQLKKDNYSDVTSTIKQFDSNFTLIADRSQTGWKIYCEASNRMDMPAVKSKEFELDVRYPPENPVEILDVMNGSVYSVITGHFVNLTCSITGGHPLSNLTWNKGNRGTPSTSSNTVNLPVSWLAETRSVTDLRCQSTHPMKNYTAYVVTNVLYPPGAPVLKLLNIRNQFESIPQKLTAIENSTLNLTCTVDSNPPPNLYRWSRFTNDNTSKLIIRNIQRDDAGSLACHVYNEMIPTEGTSVRGTNMSEVSVEVLYPPEVKIIADKNLIEGENLTYNCIVENGNPTGIIKWINMKDGYIVQTGNVLNFTNTSRSATGRYACVAENLMHSTDGTVRNGTSAGHFYLNVQYAAYISKLLINSENRVTVNENDTVTIVCTVEGHPAPTGSITLSTPEYGSNEESDILADNNFTVTFAVSCYDAGEYSCTVGNTLYTGENRTSTKSATLNINCSPRMSRIHVAEHKVYTSVHLPVTLTFTAVAYPVPPLSGYVWSREINNSNWRNITKANSTYNVSVQGLQSNLTVLNVTKSDYGLYNLTISNNIGSFTFTYSLIPAGKPSHPVHYGILEETVTDSSVTVWWEPEFNGGDPQRFIISYRKSSSDVWLNLSVPEQTSNSMTWTIGDLKSATQYHVLIYAKNKFGSVRIERDIVVQTKDVPKTSSVVGAAVGGGVGVVLSIAILVAAVLFLRIRAKRKRFQKSDKYTDNSSENCSEDRFKDTQHGKNFDDKIHLVSTKNLCADSPILPARQPTKRETALDMLEPIDFDDKKPDDGVYGNTYEMIRRIERLEIAELVAYLSDKTAEFFRLEYQKLPQRLIHPYNDSQLPENLPLNRYKGIYPYDHSRVKDLNDPAFFVNASYIDGHKKKKEYIASLGPLERTSKHFVTFWHMVWSEKSDVVVMLTKLIEPTGEKCEKYWPEFGTSLTYGEITVTGTGEDEFADYILRTFTLAKGKETLKFLQFHFMAWPDKSIPENTACLLEFRRTVRSKHKTGPLIVHCSAGIGRTGTFIAIDILIEEGKHKGAVNVLQCVKKMRDQRTMMVQTVEQYHYIFKAVVNALVFDNDAIAVKAFPKAMSKIKGNRIQQMYECLNKSVETDSTAESTARTVNKTQRDKNRVDSDIPGDEHRVRLFIDRDADMSEYINAVYINSFITSNHFIVAQSPLPNKVEDFLAMVVQVECSCIVSLEEMTQGQAMGMYHPSDSTTLKIGKFRISSKVLDSRETYTVSKMSVTYKGQREERQKHVYHFQYTDWPHGQKVPSNQENFIKFTKDVETFAKQCCTQESHVLVHCLNAFERSCLFCAVVTLTQKVDVEGEVCVPNILRLIRSRRRKAFPNKEQFEFCFKVVNTYIGMEKSTDTADDKTYMNTALA